jgi:DHA1 family multidrug resistance protein-like MFS transporter
MAWTESLTDIIRDAPLGQLLRYCTKNRLLQYPEERPDFKLPDTLQKSIQNDSLRSTPHTASATSSTIGNPHSEQDTINEAGTIIPEVESNNPGERDTKPEAVNAVGNGTVLVDWYSEEDPANPHNWSHLRRFFVGSLIFMYTFVVYLSSAIYTPSTQGVMEEFHVSNLTATLGLAMYVLGYGIGPLLFSPLGEIPRIGRNPVYIITLFLFVVFSIPAPFVTTFAGLVILRFLQGFFGSPCLAAGGATLGDIYGLEHFPFAMIAWVGAMSCGRKSLACYSRFAGLRD